MRKVLFPLLALVSVFILWGCPEPEPVEEGVLTPVKTEYTIGAEGGSFSISFKTNLEYKVESSDPSWLTVATKTKAVTTETVSITAKANTSVESRKANLKITAGDLNATIVVTQDGVTPKLEISGDKAFTFTEKGGEFTVTLDSNVPYTVDEIEVEWIKRTGGAGGAESFSVEPNGDTQARNARVSFSYGDLAVYVTVSQAGKPEDPYINVSPKSISAPAEGGDFNLEVSANVSYEASVEGSWLHVSGTKLTVDANTEYAERTGKVTFAGNNVSATITVKQAAKEAPYINVDVPQFDLPATAATIVVNVTSNITYKTAISASWVTDAGNGKFNVAENTTTEARTATITFSGEGVSKTVTINQQGKTDTPPVEENVLVNGGQATFNVAAEGGNIEVTVRSNVNYAIGISANWITQVTTRTVTEDKIVFNVAANSGAARTGLITFSYESMSFAVTVKQAEYVAPQDDPFLEISPMEAVISGEGGELTLNVSTNIDYEVDATDSWVSLVSKSATACTFEVATNPNTVNRSTMVMFTGDGVDPIFVTIVQEPSEEEEDPFDVGSNLSVNGTANCYIVTKAGNFTFDASAMGNGREGIIWVEAQLVDQHLWPHSFEGVYFANGDTKPKSAVVIWDDNGVVKNVKYNSSTKTISFTATGKKGNALIGLFDNNYVTTTNAPDELALWSWHIWCTDPPRRLTQYDLSDQEYILLDRNIGATSADPADGSATWGLYYQFGRKDPLKGYIGMARDLKEAPVELVESVHYPTRFYRANTKTVEWFNNSSASLATVTADLWGNPFMLHCSTVNEHPFPALRSELKKTIYDPCPPGYMVPPETTWEAVSKEDLIMTEDGMFIPTASGASFYPFAGYISPLNSDEQPERLGWFGFKGFNEKNTHHDSPFAGVYTSCTGYMPKSAEGRYGPDLASSYFLAFFMAAYYMEWDPNTAEYLYFDTKLTRGRVYGYPVRCVKQFDN